MSTKQQALWVGASLLIMAILVLVRARQNYRRMVAFGFGEILQVCLCEPGDFGKTQVGQGSLVASLGDDLVRFKLLGGLEGDKVYCFEIPLSDVEICRVKLADGRFALLTARKAKLVRGWGHETIEDLILYASKLTLGLTEADQNL